METQNKTKKNKQNTKNQNTKKQTAKKSVNKTNNQNTGSKKTSSKKTNNKNTAAKNTNKNTNKNTGSAKKQSASKNTNSNKKSSSKNTNAAKSSNAKKSVKSTKNTAAAKVLTRANSRRPVSRAADNLKVFPIGGLNEIGKNMTVLEYRDELLIIDCGMSFPEDDMYGIDVVIPDFSYLVNNAKNIVGLILTHGHEDHIGGIPYLLKQVNIPVYGTPITLGLVDNKLKEHGIKGDLRTFHAGDTLTIGKYTVEAIRTTHSVADAVCFYITTPAATLFHTGDFKIDYTPIDGEPMDLEKFAEIGMRGVDIMLADSTNALRPGFTKSERVVGETLDSIFREAKGRIIIATFSSNVNRVQKIIELTAQYGRHFSVSGKSMEKVVNLAQELGYLKIPRGSYVDLSEMDKFPDSKMVIITTGSQGEPMSALARMANDEHRNVKLKKGDMVILSSTPVPGNEKSVSNVVNKLYEKEVQVIYNEILDIHVSGHACQEELKMMHSLIKPTFFMPAHGETRHLIEHGRLAESLGMKSKNIFVLSNGDQLSVTKKTANMFKNVVSAEDIMVDGFGIGDVGNAVLRERKNLSTGGLLLVSATIDSTYKTLVAGPVIESQGFVYVKDNTPIINETRNIAEKVINAKLDTGKYDINELKDQVKTEIRRFISKNIHRSPVIIINLMEF